MLKVGDMRVVIVLNSVTLALNEATITQRLTANVTYGLVQLTRQSGRKDKELGRDSNLAPWNRNQAR